MKTDLDIVKYRIRNTWHATLRQNIPHETINVKEESETDFRYSRACYEYLTVRVRFTKRSIL
jgi:hypothetical protein